MLRPHHMLLNGHPPLLRRIQGTYWLATGGACVTTALVLFWPWEAWGGLGAVITVGSVLGLGCVVGFGVHLIRLATVLSRVRSTHYRACGRCGYDVRGLSAAGHCPECGLACDPDRLASFWERYARFNQPFGQRRGSTPPKWLKTQALRVLGLISLVFAGTFLTALALPGLAVIALCASGLFLMLSLKAGASCLGRRVCRRVVSADGLVCPECGGCGQEVNDSEVALRCDRCGRMWLEQDLHSVWSEWCPPCWDIERM